MGITVPPSIDMGAPMGAKSPILQILGPPWGPPWGPMGRPMGPHGGPNGGQFPPWGTTFFLTLFWRVNTPSRESPIYVRVCMYPYFVHAKFQVNWWKGYRVTGVRRITGPHGQLGHFTQSQFSGDLVEYSLRFIIQARFALFLDKKGIFFEKLLGSLLWT